MRVAIAGLGPKGLFALERLLDHARDLDPAARLEIDVFEPHPAPGRRAGLRPRPAALPAHELRGRPARHVVAGERRRAAQRGGARSSSGAPRAAATTRPTRRAPRSGRYLCEGFETLLRHAPPNVDVRLHARARSRRCGGAAAAGTCARPEPPAAYDEVLIAVGHQATSAERARRGLDARRAARPAVFPVERWLAPRTRRARGDGGDPRLRAHVHRRGARPDRGPRRLVRAARPSLPPALPARRRTTSASILPFTRSGRPMLAKPGPALAARIAGARAHRGRGPRPARRPRAARSTCAATSSRS